MSSSRRSRIARLLFVMSVVFCVECRDDREAAREMRRWIVEQNSAQRKPSRTARAAALPRSPITAGRPTDNRIYIDATVSMAGFARAPKPNDFQRTIDLLATHLRGVTIYRYGEGENAGRDNVEGMSRTVILDSTVTRPEFYSLDFNPDDVLIRSITAEQPNGVVVLLTDGVYSDKNETSLASVVEAIDQWMDRGRVFAIFTLSSPYAGNYYSEQRRAVLPWNGAVNRPFYAFVFAPDQQALNQLRHSLIGRDLAFQTLDFSDDALKCRNEGFAEAQRKGLFYAGSSASDDYYWRMLNSRYVPADAFGTKPSGDFVQWQVRCTSQTTYPATIELEPAVSYWRWSNSTATPDDGRYAGPEIRRTQATKQGEVVDTFTVRFAPQIDKSGAYGIYRVDLVPRVKALSATVRELSTPSDADASTLNRTFNFVALVEALTHRHFDSRKNGKAIAAAWVTAPGTLE